MPQNRKPFSANMKEQSFAPKKPHIQEFPLAYPAHSPTPTSNKKHKPVQIAIMAISIPSCMPASMCQI